MITLPRIAAGLAVGWLAVSAALAAAEQRGAKAAVVRAEAAEQRAAAAEVEVARLWAAIDVLWVREALLAALAEAQPAEVADG